MGDKFANSKTKDELIDFILRYLYVMTTRKLLYEYFWEQYLFAQFPHDKKIVIEI
jgi:ATP-dependent Lhr-like helicase